MSLSILRSRLLKSSAINTNTKNLNTIISQRFHCTNLPKESPLSSASSQPNEVPPSSPPKNSNAFFTALRFGLTAAITGAAASVGYATYAYTLEEVDEKTKAFRASANHHIEDDASFINKFQALGHYAAVVVPAKAIELYLDWRRSVEDQVRGFTEPLSDKLLPDLPPGMQHVFTLIVDLNETLVYSDWKYVDPVLDRLDEKHCIAHRLSRAATRYEDGKYYRDLSKLNRDPKRVIYISGHALENCLQPDNCVQIKPWKSDDVDDTTLLDLLPFLEFVARSGPSDIRQVLASYKGKDIPKEFIERSKEHQSSAPLQRTGFFACFAQATDSKTCEI
uniref:Mitochondrial import inner membrane translocase subunit TIM50 n=1 Tax=Chenopodium quinoa TaxID=63459 RepID=A0A803KUF4_CHEQI